MKNFIKTLKNYFGLDLVEKNQPKLQMSSNDSEWREMALNLQDDLQATQSKLNASEDENWKLRGRLAVYAEMAERGNQNG